MTTPIAAVKAGFRQYARFGGRATRRNEWMKDADKARLVNSRAIEAGRLVRDQWDSEYVRGLLAE